VDNYNRAGSGDLDAIKSDGTLAPNVEGVGCTLTAGTWYFPFGSQLSPTPADTALIEGQLAWAAAVAGAITVEFTNFPAKRGGLPIGARVDVADNDATAGNWIQSNPSTAQVDVVGTGNTVAAATVTAGGTNAGGAMYSMGNVGARRGRFKLVLTVGGVVRSAIHGKVGV